MSKILSTNAPVSDHVKDYVARKRATATPADARGSLVFALDATGSRQRSWDQAMRLQGDMFRAAAEIGALDIALVYFRGLANINAECKATAWTSNSEQLAKAMAGIQCQTGETQIAQVLKYTLREAAQRKISALTFIGDMCEEFEDQLIPHARDLARAGVPVFLFQEGHDWEAEQIFREIAKITGGAYSTFDPGSARQLGEFLRAVAAFATGGVKALEHQGTKAALLLLTQVR
jgi:hypothetical protein